VADLVVRDPFDIAQTKRQEGLGAIEGLDLTLLVDAQHDGVIRRMEIEADDIAHLFDEERVGGQLEPLLAMGLDPKGRPDAMDGGFGELRVGGERSARPVGAIFRLCLQGPPQQRGDLLIAERARPNGTASSLRPMQPRRIGTPQTRPIPKFGFSPTAWNTSAREK